MNKEEIFKRNIRKYKEAQPKCKLLCKLDCLQSLLKDLTEIDSAMMRWLEKEETYFNIGSYVDIDLVYSIFRNKEQYTFGDERYHYYHININTRGIKKLNKMIYKTNEKISMIEKQLEILGGKE
jgi:hypothetical protein